MPVAASARAQVNGIEQRKNQNCTVVIRGFETRGRIFRARFGVVFGDPHQRSSGSTGVMK